MKTHIVKQQLTIHQKGSLFKFNKGQVVKIYKEENSRDTTIRYCIEWKKDCYIYISELYFAQFFDEIELYYNGENL